MLTVFLLTRQYMLAITYSVLFVSYNRTYILCVIIIEVSSGKFDSWLLSCPMVYGFLSERLHRRVWISMRFRHNTPWKYCRIEHLRGLDVTLLSMLYGFSVRKYFNYRLASFLQKHQRDCCQVMFLRMTNCSCQITLLKLLLSKDIMLDFYCSDGVSLFFTRCVHGTAREK